MCIEFFVVASLRIDNEVNVTKLLLGLQEHAVNVFTKLTFVFHGRELQLL